ncbi:MAG TPA: hypothetical protein VK447_06850, partial [Myxococcaceae bacterium]|nr:hypothetical protein [Myxococcaceae bacterium]
LVFNGLQSLFNWTQDFELALEQVSSRDPRYAQLGQQYCSDWIAQFRDEGGLEQVNIRRTLAFFRFRLGDAGGAAAALHETVERWPGNVWGYVALADAYSHADPGGNIFPLDPQKARSYLERALALPGLDEYERDAVHERLEELSRV